nr:retrotransposon protein, putative, Ty1-copia subclass [Tanacetum cinerariifolium]
MDQTILKPYVEKPEKFKGFDFRRWQQKMLFYLTSLHVPYVLTNSETVNPSMVDQNVPTKAQESLKKNYRSQVACSKKFVVGKFLNFKMNDAKPIVKQVKELQIIVHEMKVEDNKMNEKADANSIEPNANMDGESSSKSKSTTKTKAKMVVLDINVLRMKRKITPNKRTTTLRKFVTVGKFYYVYLINTKDEALNMFKTYKAEVENQLDKKIKIIRSDGGGEYESNDFAEFCSTFGIGHQKTAPYTSQQNGVVEQDIRNNTIIESAEADFFENIFPNKDKEKQISNPRKRVMNDQLSQDEIDNNSEVPQENVKPRRSKRAKVTKDYGPDYMTYIVNEEPQTYKATMESLEAPYWKEAIQSEIDSIVHNNTWKLVDLPSGHKPIGHKWIFKKKLRLDGTIEKYKARLVAKECRQKEGQHFFDTYSPVTRITSIRTLIDIATINNLIIHHMDVKTAFLNGELDEEIYICNNLRGLLSKVKSIRTNMNVINQTKKMLHFSFDMKDMGEADVILDKAAEEAEWFKSFLEGIPLWPKLMTAMCIHCDSMDALTRAKNHIYCGKSRHIRRHHNTIKDLLRNEIISIDHVKSKENVDDPLTKGLCREQVIFTSRGMCLKPKQ